MTAPARPGRVTTRCHLSLQQARGIDLDAVRVVVLDGDEDGLLTVVTVPEEGCTPVRPDGRVRAIGTEADEALPTYPRIVGVPSDAAGTRSRASRLYPVPVGQIFRPMSLGDEEPRWPTHAGVRR